jgi:hypothetical protein
MKLVLRKPRDGETDCEFLFGFLFLPLSGAFSLLILHLSCAPVICMFHRLTGIPCPACGSFRCAEQLMAGHIGESFRLQPLVTLVVFVCVAFALYSWVIVILRLPRLRMEGVTRRQKWAVFFSAVALMVANWIYLLITLP